MTVFYFAFTILYVILSVSFLIANTWKAPMLFGIWFIVSTYMLLCYYSLYSLTSQVGRGRSGFRSLFASRQLSIESLTIKPNGHLSHDTNIKPIDYDEYNSS